MVCLKQCRMQRQGLLCLPLTFFLSICLFFSPLTFAAAAAAAAAGGPAPLAAPAPKPAAAAPKPLAKPSPALGSPVEAPPPKPSVSKALPPAASPPKPTVTASAPKPAPATSSPAPASAKAKPAPVSASPVSSPVPSIPSHPVGSPSSPAPKAAPAGKAKPAHSPAESPKPAPSPKKAPHSAPPPVDHSPASGPSSGPSSLNAKQVTALRSLKVNFTASDPCNSPGDDILCDKAGKTIIGLTVRNCSKTAILNLTVLADLAGVQVLQFVDCPLPPPSHVPKALVATLTSFYCTASLGRTGINEKIPRLKEQWLSQLVNLGEILVTEVDVSGKGLYPITESIPGLTNLTISKTGIGGLLPRNTWPSGVEYIDVSNNQIKGPIPKEMQALTRLKHLDLSQNQLKGVIPDIFGSLNNLQHVDLSNNQLSGPLPGSFPQLFNCSHLDLSNNKLNGSIPANLTSLKALKYLDLSQNQFTGEIKFNSSFLKRLKVLKIVPNPKLCYNHSAIKSKFLTGIQNCAPLVDDSLFAPAPAPAFSEDLNARSGGSGGLSKGAAAGISIVVIVAAVVIFFVGRKIWKARQSRDQFINMRP